MLCGHKSLGDLWRDISQPVDTKGVLLNPLKSIVSAGGVSVKILHAVPQQLLKQKGDPCGKAETDIGTYGRKLQ